MIAIIDYGMGNLRSVQKAFERVGARAKVTSSAKDLERAEKIVLPGVGSFGAAMRELKRLRLIRPIKDAIAGGKYFLGLCLGLQLLFEKSEEAPGVKGLGVLKGEVKRFKVMRKSLERSFPSRSRDNFSIEKLKVPHMGWNRIEPDGSYVYFVHSYYVKPKDKKTVLMTTDYGVRFASGVHKDNIYGFQFHPEKSQDVGLKIIKNFVRLKCK